ncbi:MAG: CAP domain-containing protein [Cyanobacteria bacterium P01_C01_bin.69]
MFDSRSYQRLQKKCSLLISTVLAAVVLSNFPQSLVSFEAVESEDYPFSFSLSWSMSADNSAQAQIAAIPGWSSMEMKIVEEHNRVRQDPQSYIPVLEAYLARMTEDGYIIHGCGRDCVLTTREGRVAVEEAIAFLRQQPAVGPLAISSPVARAAKSHAQDQRGGAMGHVSSDGTSFLQRLSRFGVRSAGIGENIAYGAQTAEQVVMNLIVDDGVPDRGHRTNIFAPQWTMAGTGCGDHAGYRTVCVINYATGL